MSDGELPTIAFRDAGEWEAWLEEQHETVPGVWVRLAKKGSGIESVTYDEAVEVALCFGWIDGLARSVDERTYAQRFTARRPRSTWSASNRKRVRALIEAGRMRPAGLRAIERAQAASRWEPQSDAASHERRREQ